MKFFSLTSLILVISAFLIAVSATAVPTPESHSPAGLINKRQDGPLCPMNTEKKYLTVPDSKCRQYYDCTGDNGRVVRVHNCPEGQQYSESREKCISSLFKLCFD